MEFDITYTTKRGFRIVSVNSNYSLFSMLLFSWFINYTVVDKCVYRITEMRAGMGYNCKKCQKNELAIRPYCGCIRSFVKEFIINYRYLFLT